MRTSIGMFTLPDTGTKGKKMNCIEFCGCVHPEHRRPLTEIPIEFCVNLSVSVSVSESVSLPSV